MYSTFMKKYPVAQSNLFSSIFLAGDVLDVNVDAVYRIEPLWLF